MAQAVDGALYRNRMLTGPEPLVRPRPVLECGACPRVCCSCWPCSRRPGRPSGCGPSPSVAAAPTELPLLQWVATAHQLGIVGYRDPAVGDLARRTAGGLLRGAGAARGPDWRRRGGGLGARGRADPPPDLDRRSPGDLRGRWRAGALAAARPRDRRPSAVAVAHADRNRRDQRHDAASQRAPAGRGEPRRRVDRRPGRRQRAGRSCGACGSTGRSCGRPRSPTGRAAWPAWTSPREIACVLTGSRGQPHLDSLRRPDAGDDPAARHRRQHRLLGRRHHHLRAGRQRARLPRPVADHAGHRCGHPPDQHRARQLRRHRRHRRQRRLQDPGVPHVPGRAGRRPRPAAHHVPVRDAVVASDPADRLDDLRHLAAAD